MHNVIHGALGQAVRWGGSTRNVAAMVERPTAAKAPKRALSLTQIGWLLAAVEEDRLEALYWLAIATGLRQGELLALRWTDVNLDVGTISVSRKVRRVGRLGLVEGQPKSDAGRRAMTIPPIATEALRRHRGRQEAERESGGVGWTPFGLIFCRPGGEQIDASVWRKTEWYPLLKRADLAMEPPLWFHELRHTNGSLMIAGGIDVKKVQQRLGHASAQVTLDIYAHVMPEIADDAARVLDSLLRRVV